MKRLEQSFEKKKVLVTGGLGFVGSNLTRRLVELSAEVSIVDSLLPDQGGNHFNLDGLEDSVNIQVADIQDTDVMSGLFKEIGFSSDDLKDLFPSFIDHSPQAGNQVYSLAFMRSMEVMYL